MENQIAGLLRILQRVRQRGLQRFPVFTIRARVATRAREIKKMDPKILNRYLSKN